MTVTWTNHDRAALSEWLSTDLGSKFLRYFESQRPPIPDNFDLNTMAMAGAMFKGYEYAVRQVVDMGRLPGPSVPPIKFVDTEKD